MEFLRLIKPIGTVFARAPRYINLVQNPGQFIRQFYSEKHTFSGWGGIRTPGTFRYAGFQNRCNRPLCHPSDNERVLRMFRRDSTRKDS